MVTISKIGFKKKKSRLRDFESLDILLGTEPP